MAKSYGWWWVGDGPGDFTVISWDWGYSLFPFPISQFPSVPNLSPQSKSQTQAQAQSQSLDI